MGNSQQYDDGYKLGARSTQEQARGAADAERDRRIRREQMGRELSDAMKPMPGEPTKVESRDTGRHTHSVATCFPKGTRIRTPNGEREISTLATADLVMSVDVATGRLRPHEILSMWSHKNARLWRLDFADGSSVRTTASHSFRADGRWKPARAIAPGDTIHFVDADGCGAVKTVRASFATQEVEDTFGMVVDGDFTFVADGAVAHSFTLLRRLRMVLWTTAADVRRAVASRRRRGENPRGTAARV